MNAGGMLQFAFGLAVVLGLIVAAGWFMKRFNVGPSAAGLVRVVAGAAVGQRERVVIVEVGDTWMVLGVAPGRVSPIATLPKGDAGAPAFAPPGSSEGFAGWLRQTMEKRRNG